MNILGLNFGHDGSACIIKNGKILSAISSERITRQKKFVGITKEVIDYVLDDSGVSVEEIDAIALSDYMLKNNGGVLELYDGSEQILNTTNQYFENNYKEVLGLFLGKEIQVFIVPHHMSHAAAAYYTSNFESSWCFSMDSSYGDTKSNNLIARGNGNKLEAISSPGLMVGVGYAMFTELAGIGPALYKAGSTMGLASYGDPTSDVIDNIKEYVEKCYFDTANQKLYLNYYFDLWEKWNGTREANSLGNVNNKHIMNMSANMQFLFENAILDCISKIEKGGIENLCLSGGSMLNCNVNSMIKNKSGFKDVHLFPACGDDGISVGAALYVAHHIFDEKRYVYDIEDICYLGKEYAWVEPDYNQLAKMIADGKTIAWFMGRSEFGPRALGNRSILADPRNFHNREILNFVVKNREWFRPYAPVVLEEKCNEWFDFDGISPYMLYTAKVLKPDIIPAVTHIDGTARMQTITEKTNKPYYNLIKAFEDITGVPVLINTSLNGNNEPILETENDALNFFYTSNIDVLVLNGTVYTK